MAKSRRQGYGLDSRGALGDLGRFMSRLRRERGSRLWRPGACGEEPGSEWASGVEEAGIWRRKDNLPDLEARLLLSEEEECLFVSPTQLTLPAS
ncbi:hypothetical protein AN958_06687 [Leucoagaricus sp. SymC.cos]|nr:hypothetical protein AN958_06687 [Leucoagaricus sp. SymC.cos]